MVHHISLLRLSALVVVGSVVAGCAVRTLTARAAVAGVPVAVLLVAVGALALVAALLVWRRRWTVPSRAGGQVGWSVTADGPGARDAEFALAPGAARDTAHAASGGPAPDVAAPPASEPDAPADADGAGGAPADGSGHEAVEPAVGAPAVGDAQPLTTRQPSAGDPSPDAAWWSEEEPPGRQDDLAERAPADAGDVEQVDDLPDPDWDVEPEPAWSTGTRDWFDEPEPTWNDGDAIDDDLLDPSSTDRR